MKIVRIHSHRARSKLWRALGERETWFVWGHDGEYVKLSAADAAVAVAIKGVTGGRPPGELRRHWPRTEAP